MKKFLILILCLVASPILAQEIKVITTSFARSQEVNIGGPYFDLVKPGFVSKMGSASSWTPYGIYIIEVEGVKYIVNAAGGIVLHNPIKKE